MGLDKGLTVRWSQTSLRNLDKIEAYFLRNWTSRELSTFKENLSHLIQIISDFPFLFPATQKRKNVRKAVLVLHVVIIYLVKPEAIYVLGVYPSKSNWK